MNNSEMDNRTRRRWIEALLTLEDAGKTDSAFYRRALAIAEGRNDPGFIHTSVVKTQD